MRYEYRTNPEVANRTHELMDALDVGDRIKVDHSEEYGPFYIAKVDDEYRCHRVDGTDMWPSDENMVAFYVSEGKATVQVV